MDRREHSFLSILCGRRMAERAFDPGGRHAVQSARATLASQRVLRSHHSSPLSLSLSCGNSRNASQPVSAPDCDRPDGSCELERSPNRRHLHTG